MNNKPTRIVVVDDSPTARTLLISVLQDEYNQVVGSASNGVEAVRLIERLKPDIVVMDVVMPELNGLEATQWIMREMPTPIVLVSASLMQLETDLTFKALKAGALAVINKPGLADPESCAELTKMVRLMAHVPVVRRHSAPDNNISRRIIKPNDEQQPEQGRNIKIIGIASSTGGPGTLAKIISVLDANFPIPIVVVQHITDGFAAGLASWLNGETELNVRLAGYGDIPQPGSVLLAPDDYHIRVNSQGVIELFKGDPYRRLRPAANYLFHSLAKEYGRLAMGIVLTGMGDDGADGLKAMYDSGSLTIAQDEKSSVVYGMPKEAIERKAAKFVMSPQQIGTYLQGLGAQIKKQQKD